VNTLKTASLALLFALGFSSRVAHAQEWTRQSFLLPHGGFEITGDPARPDLMRVNMSRNSAFKPINFPVDFFWGVSDRVTLGITHEVGPRFNTGVQNPKFRDNYNDVGFGMVIGLADGRNYEVDLHAGAPLHQLSPDIWVGAQIGVLGRANFAQNVAFVYDPSLYFGLNHRDQGNGDVINLPFWFYFQATEIVVPFVGSGLHGPLQKFGDNYTVPLEGGVLFTVGHGDHIGVDLEFPDLFGNNGNSRGRQIGFIGQFRF
jgi:hypothetical protein